MYVRCDEQDMTVDDLVLDSILLLVFCYSCHMVDERFFCLLDLALVDGICFKGGVATVKASYFGSGFLFPART